MSLPSSMADFVPCDRLLQKAYRAHKKRSETNFQGKHNETVRQLQAQTGKE